MKQSRFASKALMLLLASILLVSVFGISSSAANVEYASHNNEWGQVVCTNSKYSAPVSSFKFYGDETYLYFMLISEGKEDAQYAIEIYDNSKFKGEPISASTDYFSSSKSNILKKIRWPFRNLHSGTYYGRCYTFIERDSSTYIDSDSVMTFKFKIDRLSKKTVALGSVKNTESGVKLFWTPLQTATKYKVLRKAEGEKKWTTVDTLGEGKSAFTDKTAKSGKKYTYTVKAYDGDYKSKADTKGVSITYLATPKLNKISTSTSKGYVKLSWEKVSGSKGYYIYRKGGSLNSYNWEKIATIKGGKTVSYVDKTATNTDWYYTYTVRAFNGSFYSAYNSDGVDFNYLPAPALKSAAPCKDGIEIKWSHSDSDTTKYIVYRETSDGWKSIGTTTKKSFVDTTVKSGKAYTYTVRAAAKTNKGAYDSNGVKAKYIGISTIKSVKFDDNQNAVISWSKVGGADGYIVYRRSDDGKKWEKIAEINKGTTTKFVDTIKKVSGKTYKYTVRAKLDKTLGYYATSKSNVFLSVPKISLANKTLSDGTSAVKIAWKAIKGADRYTVYRRLPGEAWKKIASKLTDTAFYDKKAECGTAYEYMAKAHKNSYESKYSAKPIIALSEPVMKDVIITEAGAQITWDAVEGAQAYYVYRKSPNGKWTSIGSYAENYFTDTDAAALAKSYSYTVCAEAEGFTSPYNKDGLTNYTKPASLKAQFTDATEDSLAFITVSWKYDGICDYVELYKSTAGEEKILVGTYYAADGVTSYVDYDISIGTSYEYSLTAVKEGKLSRERTATAKYPHAPVEAVEFNADGEYNDGNIFVTINWTPVEFAEQYEVYRRTGASTEWTLIHTASADEATEQYTYTDTDIDTETKYYYTVKGVASDRDSLYDTEGKLAIVLEPLDPATGIIATEETADGVTVAVISWEEVKNAHYYYVYRKTADTDWEQIALLIMPDNYSFTDDSIIQGVEYTYTIGVSAEGRGNTINPTGVDFCWALPEAPETTEPETTEPDTTEPDTTEPETTEPETTEPETTEPDTTEPEATEPETTEPETTEPETTEPETTEPETTEPETTIPETTIPNEDETEA